MASQPPQVRAASEFVVWLTTDYAARRGIIPMIAANIPANKRHDGFERTVRSSERPG
jgi:hypothetical protein